jgi:hypothetical protein
MPSFLPSLLMWPRFFTQPAPTGSAACRLHQTIFCFLSYGVPSRHMAPD